MISRANLSKFHDKFINLKIGNYVTAKVQLVKDYGIILEVEQGITGFLMLGLH